MKTNYNIADSIFSIGAVKYKIDKLTKDSLIIHENKQNIDPAKFRRYSYVNTATNTVAEKPVFDDDVKDSVYNATTFLFPTYNGTSDVLLNSFGNVEGKGSLRVSFIINKDNKLVDFKVLESNNLKQSIIRSITNGFQLPDSNWVAASIKGQKVDVSVEIIINVGDFYGRSMRF